MVQLLFWTEHNLSGDAANNAGDGADEDDDDDDDDDNDKGDSDGDCYNHLEICSFIWVHQL